MSLKGRTIVMSGGSRGIGEAIAVKLARDGANVALLAKTAEPHPKLPGTIFTAAKAIEEAGGVALPLVGDIRDDDFVASAVAKVAAEFGGIDVVINNASAIDLSRTEDLSMKKFDLMNNINARGTFLLSKLCIPHLRKSVNPHILSLSPPLQTEPRWHGKFTGYTMSKFGMSLVTLGLAEELREDGIGVNSLWPRTTIFTAATRFVGRADDTSSRTVDIMADAAYVILTQPGKDLTGQFLMDDEVLAGTGVSDLSVYLPEGGRDADLKLDLWAEPTATIR
ncbi:NAD(P)-dependent oxidoreductase [Rhodococcus sp. IEGM 1366]|uniref:SDR family oxidoreductase n=1 Tax=Rhodococcus sp. IEGM 1366 TaxID=3082223 RepID=UPI002954ECBE|nr:NAD(P)-dependent oxidoreductase [Rhodococcus sp. IEGM 1366]MDV8070974.1 NAD(P)-dependent oxidoreductase [Rhodococcus sp. IEGM 1366]